MSLCSNAAPAAKASNQSFNAEEAQYQRPEESLKLRTMPA
jgi:hypothetical protein